MFCNHPIVPKNSDGVARIISIGRLSQPKETEAATQQALEAIRRENERMLASVYSGPSVVVRHRNQFAIILSLSAAIECNGSVTSIAQLCTKTNRHVEES